MLCSVASSLLLNLLPLALASGSRAPQVPFCIENKRLPSAGHWVLLVSCPLHHIRQQTLKAWWSDTDFDEVTGHVEMCWYVSTVSTYRLTTMAEEPIHSLSFDSSARVVVSYGSVDVEPMAGFPGGVGDKRTASGAVVLRVGMCNARTDCHGHGVCKDTGCECFKDNVNGYWAQPSCLYCAPPHLGPACVNLCNYNGVKESPEECDDGNEADGDGCTDCMLDTLVQGGEVNLFAIWMGISFILFVCCFCTA